KLHLISAGRRDHELAPVHPDPTGRQLDLDASFRVGEPEELVIVEHHHRQALVPCTHGVERGYASGDHRAHPGDLEGAYRGGSVAAHTEVLVGNDDDAFKV